MHMSNTKLFYTVTGEQCAELACVEVVAVIERSGEGRHSSLPGGEVAVADCGLRAHRLGIGLPVILHLPGRQNVRHGARKRGGEGMVIAVALGAIDPSVEAGALLERSVAFREELGLIDPDNGQCLA